MGSNVQRMVKTYNMAFLISGSWFLWGPKEINLIRDNVPTSCDMEQLYTLLVTIDILFLFCHF